MKFIILCFLFSISLLIEIRLQGIKSDKYSQETTYISNHQYQQVLLDKIYQGTFTSNSQKKLFDYLEFHEGKSRVQFTYDQQFKKSKINSMIVTLFNPIYHDLKAILFQFQLPSYSQNTSRRINKNTQFFVYEFHKQRIKKSYHCNASIQINIINLQTNDLDDSIVNLQIQSQENVAPQCMINFTSSNKYTDEKQKVIQYSIFLSSLAIFEILCIIKVLKNLKNNSLQVNKLSITTIMFCIIQDLYFILFCFIYLMNDNNNYLFYIPPIFLFILLTFVFEVKLLITMLKAKKNKAQTMQQRQNNIIVYILSFIGIIIYYTITFIFPFQKNLILLQALIFVPQIYQNCCSISKPIFSLLYFLGFLTFRRILVNLYSRGCPSNIFHLQTSIVFCIAWIFIFAIQIVILYLQAKKSANFFIPKILIPGYYQYEFKYKIDYSDVIQCPICLQGLCSQTTAQVSTIPNTLNQQLLKQIYVIKAPCNHMFHKSCFINWIQLKLQCPVCRKQLPPFIN